MHTLEHEQRHLLLLALCARFSIFQRFPTLFQFGSKWDEEIRDNYDDSSYQIWAYTGPNGNTTLVNPTTRGNESVSFGNWLNVGPQYQSTNVFELGRTNGFTMFNVNGQQGMAPRASRAAMASRWPRLWVPPTPSPAVSATGG